MRVPVLAMAQRVRVEFLNLLKVLTRRRTESLEDLKHVRACLGNGPESVGDAVQVELLNLLTRRRTESLEDLRHVINATRHRA